MLQRAAQSVTDSTGPIGRNWWTTLAVTPPRAFSNVIPTRPQNPESGIGGSRVGFAVVGARVPGAGVGEGAGLPVCDAPPIPVGAAVNGTGASVGLPVVGDGDGPVVGDGDTLMKPRIGAVSNPVDVIVTTSTVDSSKQVCVDTV